MVTDSRSWTLEDLDTLPDDGGWTRYEIVGGELFMTRSPHAFHQRVASRLNIVLGIWSDAAQSGDVLQTPGLVFTRQDAVSPDLIWVSGERFAHALDEAGHFTVAPELVVEVLSPGKSNEHRDRDTKLQLYSKYGVQEYWIVSWQRQTIEVYRCGSEGLEWVSTLGVEDTLDSPILPGFRTPVSQIFG